MIPTTPAGSALNSGAAAVAAVLALVAAVAGSIALSLRRKGL